MLTLVQALSAGHVTSTSFPLSFLLWSAVLINPFVLYGIGSGILVIISGWLQTYHLLASAFQMQGLQAGIAHGVSFFFIQGLEDCHRAGKPGYC